MKQGSSPLSNLLDSQLDSLKRGYKAVSPNLSISNQKLLSFQTKPSRWDSLHQTSASIRRLSAKSLQFQSSGPSPTILAPSVINSDNNAAESSSRSITSPPKINLTDSENGKNSSSASTSSLNNSNSSPSTNILSSHSSVEPLIPKTDPGFFQKVGMFLDDILEDITAVEHSQPHEEYKSIFFNQLLSQQTNGESSNDPGKSLPLSNPSSSCLSFDNSQPTSSLSGYSAPTNSNPTTTSLTPNQNPSQLNPSGSLSRHSLLASSSNSLNVFSTSVSLASILVPSSLTERGEIVVLDNFTDFPPYHSSKKKGFWKSSGSSEEQHMEKMEAKFQKLYPLVNLPLERIRQAKRKITNTLMKLEYFDAIIPILYHFDRLLKLGTVHRGNYKVAICSTAFLNVKFHCHKDSDKSKLLEKLAYRFDLHPNQIVRNELFVFIDLDFRLMMNVAEFTQHDRYLYTMYKDVA